MKLTKLDFIVQFIKLYASQKTLFREIFQMAIMFQVNLCLTILVNINAER